MGRLVVTNNPIAFKQSASSLGLLPRQLLMETVMGLFSRAVAGINSVYLLAAVLLVKFPSSCGSEGEAMSAGDKLLLFSGPDFRDGKGFEVSI